MRQSPRLKKVVSIVLLAALCIGGTELAVCRHVDPALYETIVSPVRRTAQAAADTVSDGASALWDAAGDVFSQAAAHFESDEPEPPEDQAAAEPDALLSVLTADPAITALKQRGDCEILTGGSCEVVYFNQADDQWSSQPYGRDTLGKYGCGPTALAMAVSSLTGEIRDPEAMAQWAVENGYWAKHGGSYLSIVNGTEDFGLEVESLPACDAEKLVLELASGKMVVALMTKGHFTNGGHFILLRGATLSGKILVADPNSRERSLAEWEPQLILDELSTSRTSGAPLWFLSWDRP